VAVLFVAVWLVRFVAATMLDRWWFDSVTSAGLSGLEHAQVRSEADQPDEYMTDAALMILSLALREDGEHSLPFARGVVHELALRIT